MPSPLFAKVGWKIRAPCSTRVVDFAAPYSRSAEAVTPWMSFASFAAANRAPGLYWSKQGSFRKGAPATVGRSDRTCRPRSEVPKDELVLLGKNGHVVKYVIEILILDVITSATYLLPDTRRPQWR